jgi:ethanolamine ammonia-lyase small subunit
MSNLMPPGLAGRLRALTPARVGLGRTGASQQTRDSLEFQCAHAQARDAVHARLEAAALAANLGAIAGSQLLRLHSAAPDRTTYLQRPDLGRRLDESSRARLAGFANLNMGPWDLVVVWRMGFLLWLSKGMCRRSSKNGFLI